MGQNLSTSEMFYVSMVLRSMNAKGHHWHGVQHGFQALVV